VILVVVVGGCRLVCGPVCVSRWLRCMRAVACGSCRLALMCLWRCWQARMWLRTITCREVNLPRLRYHWLCLTNMSYQTASTRTAW